MQGAMIRQQQPAPGRKPVPRGASRMVAKEPMSARLPKANFGGLKRLFWPVLLVAQGLAPTKARSV
jgi:cell division protein FtsQ